MQVPLRADFKDERLLILFSALCRLGSERKGKKARPAPGYDKGKSGKTRFPRTPAVDSRNGARSNKGKMDERTWMLLGALLYAASLLLAAVGLADRRRRFPHRYIFGCVLIGFLLQTLGIHQRGLEVHSCPIGNPFEVLQFISWSMILIYILTGPMFRMSLLGSFSATVAAVLGLTSFAVPGWDAAYGPGRLFGGDPWVETHAALALFSYGLFGMLAVTSGMYLLQNHGLKQKRTKGLFAYLPSIVQLEVVSHRLLWLACAFYTIALVIGSVTWVETWRDISLFKLTATVLLWIGYGVLLVARQRHWIRMHRAAWCGLALFAFALLVLWPVEANRGSDASQAAVFNF